MDRRRFVTTTALGTAGGLLGGARASTARPSTGRSAAADGGMSAAARAGFEDAMDRAHAARSGIALGGLGAGSAELRKDGRFHNWTCFNNEPQFTGPRLAWPSDSILFLLVRYQLAGQEPRLKLLQVEGEEHEVASVPMALYELPWLSGVDRIAYRARFPFAWLSFADEEMPLEVRLQAMSPFVPHDVEASSLPVMLLDLTVRSKAAQPIDVMLVASLRSVVGYDTADKRHVTRLDRRPGVVVCTMGADGMDPLASSLGTMSLASLSDGTTWYLGWEHRHPYYERLLRGSGLPNVDDTEGRNPADRATGKRRAMQRSFSSLARSTTLPPGGTLEHAFAVSWHFPNLWNESHTRVEGHHYARRFADSAEVALHAVEHRVDLVGRSRAFLEAFDDSSAPGFVLDQVNSHLNTFATSSWLTREGDFGILEGMTPDQSWGPIATMDVSLYGAVSVAALFPELQKASMRAHRRLQAESGEMAHGIEKDFGGPKLGVAGVHQRLDLHAEYAILVLRDFLWSADTAYLSDMWPSVKAALDYVLRERDLDGDGLPDMEGIMSSYDNFPMYGAAAFIVSQWLAALAAVVQGARAVGDGEAHARYAALLAKAAARAEERLWNGRYFRLWNDEGGSHGGKDEGCLTDQLVGLWSGHLVGLGPLLPQEKVRAALEAILAMSYRPGFGLRNCSWPGDPTWHDVPADIWVDQANTCWSGVELAFGSLLIYEGFLAEGLAVVRTVDERYRRAGRYFDHQEFGGHYFRPMAAWGILHALLGLGINEGRYTFAPRLGGDDIRLFFSHGPGTATYARRVAGGGETVAIEVRTGTFRWTELAVETREPAPRPVAVAVGEATASLPPTAVAWEEGRVVLRPAAPVSIPAGRRLEIRIG